MMGKEDDLTAAYLQGQSDTQVAMSQSTQQQQALNSGLYPQTDTDASFNTREFYLGYEDLLMEKMQAWRGKIKNDAGEWIDGGQVFMKEAAIAVVINMIRDMMSVPSRLSNLDENYVSLYAYQARKHISKFLHTVGWTDYEIPIEYMGIISFQSGQIIHAGLTWAKNAGGQRFMTRSIVSHENVSRLFTGPPGKGSEEDKKWVPKAKLW
ncbi:hypothetical protein LCGC14_0589010 [marine sediment metagenome]|uniref:Uncharacterized protein n=1 Tax=marine sediment metagenome TaxID=412755 RepID=A0A0F9RIZ0_9ZZZZ